MDKIFYIYVTLFGSKLDKYARDPLGQGYHPDIYMFILLGIGDTQRYQSLIGSFR